MIVQHEAVWIATPAIYGVLSLITYIAYAWDKRAARRGDRRIAERTLHLLDLIGGWPGGWLAQKVLRHKSVKRSFRRIFRLTVFVNGAVLTGCFYGMV